MGVSRRAVLAGAAAASIPPLTGCSSRSDGAAATPDGGSVAVGSKPFPEQRILGYMAYEAVRANTDLIAVDEMDTGESLEAWNAVVSGDIDVYWEYTGTHWEHIPPTHEEKVNDPQELYEAVRADVEAAGAAYLNRAPFDNTWALTVRQSWADRTGVETISDLAAHVNAGNTDVGIAIGEDFQTRSDGWRQLVDFYGFDSAAVEAIRENLRVVPIGLTYELLADREVDVAMAFNTDPQLRIMDVALLTDDRDFFIPYNPAPVVNGDALDAHPQLRDVLDPIGPSIDGEDTMRRLNGRAILNEESPRSIAREYLQAEGLI